MTQPPTNTRSRWTATDEARLLELSERKERIMRENLAPVRLLVSAAPIGMERSHDGKVEHEALVEWLIANADSLRDALEPFGSGVMPAPTELRR